MNKLKQASPFVAFFVGVIFISFLGLSLFIPKADNIAQPKPEKPKEKRTEIVRISALGDSLTEGVGDSTKTGGYVPILQRDLVDSMPIDVVQIDNLGKSGDRSDQILKRVKKDESIQESLKKADAILLTVGGNDLLKVIKTKMFDKFNPKSFNRPRKKYIAELDKLYQEIRKYNPNAPIFQLGIYNPFYKSFGEIEEMQEIVDQWNQSSREFVEQTDNAFFVPINDDIYKGREATLSRDENADTSETEANKKEAINNLLSEDDSFHPNNLGYQIIANAFKAKLEANKSLWMDVKE
ncbi:SGNH/GDSL hydrolase family protein [Vagococcus silagei]|uniref:Lipase n=1 Tax=Vagococcus silagei TaxID=2508885 RepID=A0A4S3B2C6_9ENTE|nr:SGNH/GDSL hydrolase family protein [Vagococcus silagei]THB61284.1 lipase [Vagococcus silagei]